MQIQPSITIKTELIVHMSWGEQPNLVYLENKSKMKEIIETEWQTA